MTIRKYFREKKNCNFKLFHEMYMFKEKLFLFSLSIDAVSFDLNLNFYLTYLHPLKPLLILRNLNVELTVLEKRSVKP